MIINLLKNEIATPFGLAMTSFRDFDCKLFYALCNNFEH
jgi:hypothetical protein